MNPSNKNGIDIQRKVSDTFSKEEYKKIMDLYQELVLKMGIEPGVSEEDIMEIVDKLDVSSHAKILCAYRIGMTIGSIITYDTAQPVIYTDKDSAKNPIVEMIFGPTPESIIEEMKNAPEIGEEEAKIRTNFRKLKLKFMDAELNKSPERQQLREIAISLHVERPDLFTELDKDMFGIK